MTDVTSQQPDNADGSSLAPRIPTKKLWFSRAGELALAEAAAPRQKKSTGAMRNLAVMTLSAGMFGTLAIPAYAFAPDAAAVGIEPMAAVEELRTESAQNVIVPASARPVEAQRDEFSATTPAELEAKRERERAEKRARELAAQQERERQQAAQAAQQAAASNGGSAAAAPQAAPAQQAAPAPQAAAAPAPKPAAKAASANGGSIVSVARQYLGVPYVFGGASPSGFDCSGLTKYVYAQFGISLPHSSAAQGANGTRVSNPQPGDLVIIDGGSHVGIYTGGGNMIDAPMPGRVVNERPIYSSNHYFVRY